jgi:hypothetical protein
MLGYFTMLFKVSVRTMPGHFIEAQLPRSVMRQLTDEEMVHYRQPYSPHHLFQAGSGFGDIQARPGEPAEIYLRVH